LSFGFLLLHHLDTLGQKLQAVFLQDGLHFGEAPERSGSGKGVLVPQWSPQNRPTVVRAKPANGRGRGLSCSTLQPPVEASLFLYANSAGRI
jgi:hypothetical protein